MGWVSWLFDRAKKTPELTMRGHEVYVEPMPEPEKLKRAFLRASRIARALEMGREGVVVVIAGKGHETYQVQRDRTVPFDDRQVARDVLARLAGAGGKR